MLSKSHRWYLFNAVLETGPGETAWAPSSIHRGRKRRKGAKKKRKCLQWTCLCWVLLLTRGFPLSPVQQSNMKRTSDGSWKENKNNYWQSGSDGVVWEELSAMLVHPPALRFECETWRTYRRTSPYFFPHRKLMTVVSQLGLSKVQKLKWRFSFLRDASACNTPSCVPCKVQDECVSPNQTGQTFASVTLGCARQGNPLWNVTFRIKCASTWSVQGEEVPTSVKQDPRTCAGQANSCST